MPVPGKGLWPPLQIIYHQQKTIPIFGKPLPSSAIYLPQTAHCKSLLPKVSPTPTTNAWQPHAHRDMFVTYFYKAKSKVFTVPSYFDTTLAKLPQANFSL